MNNRYMEAKSAVALYLTSARDKSQISRILAVT